MKKQLLNLLTLIFPFAVVQRRQMSSMPGGSGENIIYAVLCGGALVGAVSYVSSTVSRHVYCQYVEQSTSNLLQFG